MRKKLYELQNDTKIELEVVGGGKEIFTFHHMDGAYGYITRDSNHHDYVHLSARTELEYGTDKVWRVIGE